MIEKLCEFFGISQDELAMVDDETFHQMTGALHDEDFMALHHLGYTLQENDK